MSVNFVQLLNTETMEEQKEEERFLLELEQNEGHATSPKAKKITFSHDLEQTLLLEATTVNPFSDQRKWAEVANNVTQQYRAISKDDNFLVSSRACRDRINHLLKLLNQKNEASLKSLKRGCTPEEFETKVVLLEGLQKMQGSSGTCTTKNAGSLAGKLTLEKKRGEDIRLAAMTTQAKRKDDEHNDEPDESLKKKSRGKRDFVLDYIEAKRNDERQLEEKRLTLEERRIALDERRAEDERLERQRFWENAKADRELQLEKLKVESDEKQMLY